MVYMSLCIIHKSFHYSPTSVVSHYHETLAFYLMIYNIVDNAVTVGTHSICQNYAPESK